MLGLSYSARFDYMRFVDGVCVCVGTTRQAARPGHQANRVGKKGNANHQANGCHSLSCATLAHNLDLRCVVSKTFTN